MESKYLGVAVSYKGTIFAFPDDGDLFIHYAAIGRGDWPYQHLYEGDNVPLIVERMRQEQVMHNEP